MRSILDAIFYVLRTGCPWRYLPTNFPAWQTVFYHSRRFRLNGTWHLLYTALHRAERERVGRHPDPSAAIMDSQSVKTVEESAHIRGYDAHKCVKGRKPHELRNELEEVLKKSLPRCMNKEFSLIAWRGGKLTEGWEFALNHGN